MIGRPILRMDAVASTQDIAFRLAELGAPEGMAVLARHQFAGRGRAGRSWVTEPDEALTFSVILRPTVPPHSLSPLSILLADAIVESLQTFRGLSADIKWPNDVLLDGRKMAGILVQVRGGVAVAGIGINLDGGSASLPDGATSLHEHTGQVPDPKMLMHDILDNLDPRYRAVLTGDADPFIVAVNNRLWLRGSPVTVDDAGRHLSGTLRGLRGDGALLLDTAGGEVAVVSGELVRGPRPLVR